MGPATRMVARAVRGRCWGRMGGGRGAASPSPPAEMAWASRDLLPLQAHLHALAPVEQLPGEGLPEQGLVHLAPPGAQPVGVVPAGREGWPSDRGLKYL